MAWIELHQTLPTNKKTLRLKSILKIDTPQAVGHLCMLWLWAIDNAQDGSLQGFLNEEIAEISGWKKSANVFMDALKTSGFIDEDMHIHDWNEYAGKLIDKRKIDAERKRTSRGRIYNNDGKSNGRPTDIQRTSDGNPEKGAGNPCDGAGNRTIPYQTVPNHTVPISTSDLSTDLCTDSLMVETGDAAGTDEQDLKICSDFYSKSTGKLIPPTMVAELQQFLQSGADVELIKHAIGISLGKNNAPAYFRGVMQNKLSKGIKTYQQLIDAEGGNTSSQKIITPQSGGNPFLDMLKEDGAI